MTQLIFRGEMTTSATRTPSSPGGERQAQCAGTIRDSSCAASGQKKPPAGARPAGGKSEERERYLRAAAASMRPLPSWVVGRMLTAELVISARSLAGPTWPYLPTSSAARPATCGVAIEVPAAKKNVFTTPLRTFPQLGTRSWTTPFGGTRSPPGASTLSTDEP